MEVAFNSLPSGTIFRSKMTGLRYIKCQEGKEIYLDLDVYKATPNTINAFIIDSSLCLRPVVMPENAMVIVE